MALKPGTTISPYETTTISSYHDPATLLQQGWQPITSQHKEIELCRTLHNTVKTIEDFFWQRLKIVGVDNQGGSPLCLIHLDQNNAYYNPQLKHFAFNDFLTKDQEVVAHEYTHAIVAHRNPLTYEGESGAIDEAIADVVGVVFKRQRLGRTDWKIGTFRDLSTPVTKTTHYRHDIQAKYEIVKDPRTGQLFRGNTTNDYGHVHDNSIILSHAFYLASQQLSYDKTWMDQLFGIWIAAVFKLQETEKNFNGFIDKTIALANKVGSTLLIEAVKSAWSQVLQ